MSGIAHFLVLKTAKGYKIKSFMTEFISPTALITSHSVMPELLPCTLSLSRYSPNFARSESAQDLMGLTDTDSDRHGYDPIFFQSIQLRLEKKSKILIRFKSDSIMVKRNLIRINL